MKKVNNFKNRFGRPSANPVELAIENEFARVKNELKQAGTWTEFKNLLRPSRRSDLLTGVYLIGNVLSIILLTVFVSLAPGLWKVLAYFMALPLMAAQICNVGNYAHMAQHGAIFSNRQLNTIATQVLCSLMNYSQALFSAIHNLTHHFKLGESGDLERINRRPLLVPGQSRQQAVWQFILTFVLDYEAWKVSVLADLPAMLALPQEQLRLARRTLLQDLLTWLIVWTSIVGVLYAVDEQLPYHFLLLWYGAKATWYHFIRVGRELFDHYGMPPVPQGISGKRTATGKVSVLAYTRTMPSTWLTLFFNGQGDRYHTAHHLWMTIPMVNLAETHRLLVRHSATYRKSVQEFDAYFTGDRSVMGSMIKGVLQGHV